MRSVRGRAVRRRPEPTKEPDSRGPLDPPPAGQGLRRPRVRRRQGPARGLRADHADATAGRCAERPGDPARRRRLRCRERLRRPLPHPDRRAARRATGCRSPASTRRRCARPRARRCSPDATTTPWAWGPSPRSRPRHRATRRCDRTRPRRSRRCCGSTATRPPSSASATRCPVWQTSPVGPFDAWPTGGGGFEHFYGFLGGETNQYAPALYSGHDTGRAGGHARGGLPLHRGHDRPRDRLGAPAARRSRRTGRSSCTTHPARRTRRTTSRSSGPTGTAAQFDDGWDALRERDLRRAEAPRRRARGRRAHGAARRDPRLGRHARRSSSRCSHARWRSTPGSSSTPTTTSAAWSTRSTTSGSSTTRSSSTSSATTGPRPRAHINGSFNEYLFFNGAAALETPEFLAARIDQFGTPEAYNHFSVGWAHAMDTPYQWTKQVASHWGGTRNGTIVHWPQGISATRRGPPPVPPRDRHRADGARRRRASRTPTASTAPSRCRCTA